MRKFLKTLLYFTIPILLAVYVMDVFISRNLLKSNESPSNYNTWNDIYNGNVNSDILIYGSSRASMQIDPKILEDSLNRKVYNFGMLGHNFLTQYLRHVEYLKYNPPPKQIIMCVDYFSFEKREDLYESDQFLPYMLWNYTLWKYTNSYPGFSIMDHTLPLVRYFGKGTAIRKAFFVAFNKSTTKPLKRKGYRSTDKPWNKEMEEARLKRGIYIIKNETESIQIFNRFLQECSRNKITVTLVYTPEYVEVQKLVKNRKKILDLYQLFAKKNNLTLLDYSNDSICLNKDYFYNAAHLNKTGSVLFSKKLAGDLLNLNDIMAEE